MDATPEEVPGLADPITAELVTIDAITDPWERARRAHALVNHLQAQGAEASRRRLTALRALAAEGTKHADLGRYLGLTGTRVGQLLSAGVRAERALLGTGDTITVAVGGKTESGRTNPSVVISAEALDARETIQRLCAELGLNSDHELIPPPGIVRLNRDDLVVLCSPRLLPVVGEILESDDDLGFRNGAQGWYLVDRTTATTYRSPSDHGEPVDYGYIGRLPRPDGKGTFLYLAGVHAMGTKGAAHFLAENAADLYREVRTSRWSVLVECRYDPDSREILSTAARTPIYRHRGA